MQDRWDAARIFIARLKVEFPELTSFPRFRATLSLVALLGVFALLYGRIIYKSDDSISISLLISGVAWIAATFVVLLKNPLPRFWRLIVQNSVIGLFLLAVLTGAIAYSTWFLLPNAEPSIRLVWTIFAGVFLYLSLTGFRYAFGKMNRQEPAYPGRLTSPFLFALALTNLIGWYWSSIIHFFL